MPQYILKQVTHHAETPDGVDLTVAAFQAAELPGTPGWLTGETPEQQGLETGMPNLPQDLQLPPLERTELCVRVRVVGPDTIRVMIAPAEHRMFTESPTWPGILIAETNGPVDAGVSTTGERIRVAFAESELVIGSAPFTLGLNRRGTPLLRTGERLRQVAGFPMAPPVLSSDETIALSLEMGVDENIFGFGEQFNRLAKNGQQLTLSVEDALGTGTGLTYKPVPLWHSSAGYSAFVNTGAAVTADIGQRRPSVLEIGADDTGLDMILFTAPTLKERLRDYTRLTGTAGRPDLFAFGYWVGRCRYHSREEMLEVADRMRQEQVPADVLHLDPDWLIVDRLNTDYIWNEDRFGPRKAFIEALRDRKFRLSLWELPYLDPASPLFDEAADGGHLLRTPDGAIAEIQGTPTPDGRIRALYDYTNPATVDWLAEKNRPFFEDGLAVIKTDFGEGCPPGVVAADGTPGNYIHNLFPLKYNGAVYDIIDRLGSGQPLVWGRSGWAGSQRFPGQWGGDAESTVVGMQATLRGGLSYALSAPGLWSHDIGGFYGPELTPGLYVRWTQFGAFSPLMRAHGLRPREPWEFGDEALHISRDWIRLRYSLLPYIWQVAAQVEREGLPFIRPLVLEYEDDPIAPTIDDQYMFGSDMLVAPVFDDSVAGVERTVYLPAGTWYDFFTDERFEGPTWVRRTVPLTEMPVFVRDGASVPRVEVDGIESTEDVLDAPWTLHTWGRATKPADMVGFRCASGEELPVIIATEVRHGSTK
jgi:alpha-D-xyloside xylohydrolase